MTNSQQPPSQRGEDQEDGAVDTVQVLMADLVPRAVTMLRALPDPAARAAAAASAIVAAEGVRGQLAEVRRDAVRELRGSGRPPLRTWAEVGELISTTGARAQQIAGLPADVGAPRGPRTKKPPN